LEFVRAIRSVADGDAVIAPSVTRRLLDTFAHHIPDPQRPAEASHPELGQLTARERQILTELAGGLSNAEIAERLFVAEATVKTHLGRILTKLGLRDRVQAVVYAYEAGLAGRHPRQ
jgi:DNA-binding NarL/FixJ family response regulator